MRQYYRDADEYLRGALQHDFTALRGRILEQCDGDFGRNNGGVNPWCAQGSLVRKNLYRGMGAIAHWQLLAV